jgi:hypothetical protein
MKAAAQAAEIKRRQAQEFAQAKYFSAIKASLEAYRLFSQLLLLVKQQ